MYPMRVKPIATPSLPMEVSLVCTSRANDFLCGVGDHCVQAACSGHTERQYNSFTRIFITWTVLYVNTMLPVTRDPSQSPVQTPPLPSPKRTLASTSLITSNFSISTTPFILTLIHLILLQLTETKLPQFRLQLVTTFSFLQIPTAPRVL